VDGRSIAPNASIVMAPGSGRLEISYAPIVLHSQDGIRFRYILEGFDKQWTDAGSRRVASYTNLPVGRYTFRVAALEVNNPQAVSNASLTIVQEPASIRRSGS